MFETFVNLVGNAWNATIAPGLRPLFALVNVLYRMIVGTSPALYADVLAAANIAGTYANGSSGVGATLTVTATGALTVDGQTVALGNYVLLTGQSTGAQNGLYQCTTAGATGVSPVLTRAGAWNSSALMVNGTLFAIRAGTTYGGQTWAYTGASSPTVGVTALTFAVDGLIRAAVAATITAAQSFAAGTLKVLNAAGTFATTLASNATAARTATLPDASGNVLLDSQALVSTPTTNQIQLGAAGHVTTINSAAPAAAAQTINIPDSGAASDTVMLRGLAETITAAKTFNVAPVFGAGVAISPNATGGVGPAGTANTVNWTMQQVPTSPTQGNDSANTNGDIYWAPVFIPYNTTITGIQYLIGSVGGTDKVIAALYSAAGVLLANSALAGTLVGTAANMMQVPFTAPYAAIGPGLYYVAVQFNGTTAHFRSAPAFAGMGGGASMATGSQAGAFGTLAAITPGTTFNANKGVIASTY